MGTGAGFQVLPAHAAAVVADADFFYAAALYFYVYPTCPRVDRIVHHLADNRCGTVYDFPRCYLPGDLAVKLPDRHAYAFLVPLISPEGVKRSRTGPSVPDFGAFRFFAFSASPGVPESASSREGLFIS